MSETRKPSAPKDLGSRGRKFWLDITAAFELERDETELLLEICRAMDLADALAAVLAAEGHTTEGSRGQRVAHPVIAPLTTVRGQLSRMLAQLGLPDQDAVALASPASTQARRAAQARWRGHTPRGRRGAA